MFFSFGFFFYFTFYSYTRSRDVIEMSVEAFVVAAVVDEGTPALKKLFQAGVQRTDFPTYEEEFAWIVMQAEAKRPINWRRFQEEFPEFERVVPKERLQDLCEELKMETAFMTLHSALDQTVEELSPSNAIEKASFLREIVQEVLRIHAPHSDIVLSSDYGEYLREMKELQVLRENGQQPGIPTRIKTLDDAWGGLQNGRVALVLGRPGDAKSYFQAFLFAMAFLDGRRVGMFSPEMNEKEHRARIATILTAIKQVQEALGITSALKNKALIDGSGYNYKTLKRFWEWVDEQPGAMVLHTNKFRGQKMTPAFIEARLDDLGLEMLIIDPIYKLKPSHMVKGQSGWERLQFMTDEICDLAEQFDIPIVMSNQAHRQQGNRGDAPHKDTSFNGDAPVQEADHVIGVKHVMEERKLILRCTKNRFGQDFRVDLKFLPNVGILKDVSANYHGHEDGSGSRNGGTRTSSKASAAAVRELEKEMEHDPR